MGKDIEYEGKLTSSIFIGAHVSPVHEMLRLKKWYISRRGLRDDYALQQGQGRLLRMIVRIYQFRPPCLGRRFQNEESVDIFE